MRVRVFDQKVLEKDDVYLRLEEGEEGVVVPPNVIAVRRMDTFGTIFFCTKCREQIGTLDDNLVRISHGVAQLPPHICKEEKKDEAGD